MWPFLLLKLLSPRNTEEILLIHKLIVVVFYFVPVYFRYVKLLYSFHPFFLFLYTFHLLFDFSLSSMNGRPSLELLDPNIQTINKFSHLLRFNRILYLSDNILVFFILRSSFSNYLFCFLQLYRKNLLLFIFYPTLSLFF